MLSSILECSIVSPGSLPASTPGYPPVSILFTDLSASRDGKRSWRRMEISTSFRVIVVSGELAHPYLLLVVYLEIVDIASKVVLHLTIFFLFLSVCLRLDYG